MTSPHALVKLMGRPSTQSSLRGLRQNQGFNRPVDIEQCGVGVAADTVDETLQFDLIGIADRQRTTGRGGLPSLVTVNVFLGGPFSKTLRSAKAARSNRTRKPTVKGDPGGIRPLAMTVA